MAQSFTTDVTKWQGVDDEPTAGSDNLVKSGGVYEETNASKVVEKIKDDIVYSAELFPYVGILRRNGGIESAQGYKSSDYIDVVKRYIYFDGIFPSQGYSSFSRIGLILYDSSKQPITYIGEGGSQLLLSGRIDLTGDYPQAKYFRACLVDQNYSYLIQTDDSCFTLKESLPCIRYTGYGNHAQYQNDKIAYIDCHIKEEYKGYNVQIIQLGWFEQLKRFIFLCVLNNGQTVITTISKIYVNHKSEDPGGYSYDSIPLSDCIYDFYIALSGTQELIGKITIKYLWSKIGGDTSNHLLNLGSNYNNGINLPSSSVFYDFDEQIRRLADYGISFGNDSAYGFRWWGTPSAAMESGVVVTIKDSAVVKDSIIRSLTIWVKVAGKFKIGIGHMDQRSWYLEQSSFDVETENTGEITFNLIERQIIIPEGEQLFIYTTFYGNETIGWNNGTNDKGFYYGSPSGALGYFPNGGYCTIYYIASTITTPFASKSDLEYMDGQLDVVGNVASTAMANNFKAKDRQGNFYKLLVVNGNLQVLPIEYSNVLVIGNSLCEHDQVQDFGGWYASGRGMASTVIGNDYCGLLQTGMRQKTANVVVTRFNEMVPWFRYPYDTSDEKFDELFHGILSNNYDLIVFSLNANNTEHIDMIKDATVACIKYIWKHLPSADAVITSDCNACNPARNAQLSAAAVELGIPYIESNLNWKTYMYKDKNNNYCPYFYQGDDMQLYPLQDKFCTHFNDYGMYLFANAILSGINYPTLDLRHNVWVDCQQDYEAWFNGIENGIISVLLYGNSPSSISIKDANNNDVSYTLHDMSNVNYFNPPVKIPTYGITFVMPSTNVSVVIR
jgi:hypothetical protein